MLPESDYLPETVKLVISAVLGAGGVAFFRVWLENRRLSKKEFRETLLDRVRELEKVIGNLQTRMGNLRVEMAHLETENKALKRERDACEIRNHPGAGCPTRPTEDEDADQQLDRGDDDGEPA
jgi:regulator of replication initiation timing